MTRSGLLLLSLVTLHAPACVHTLADPQSGEVLRPSSDPFPYEPAPLIYELTALEIESDEPWRSSALSFPAADTDDDKNPTVRAVVRQPRDEAHGLIVILPVLSGDYGPSDGFARDLSERGFTTVRLERKLDLLDPDGDFDLVVRRMTQSVVDLRRVLDWARQAQISGSAHIGLLGISTGSLVGTLASAADDRIDATVLVMGGASVVEILEGASDNEVVARFFEGLESRGWDQERISNEAHAHLDPIDPIRFAAFMDPRTTLLVHGRFDDVIPMENGTRLWEAAGKPERVVVPIGHYTAWMLLPHLHSVTADHFEHHLQ